MILDTYSTMHDFAKATEQHCKSSSVNNKKPEIEESPNFLAKKSEIRACALRSRMIIITFVFLFFVCKFIPGDCLVLLVHKTFMTIVCSSMAMHELHIMARKIMFFDTMEKHYAAAGVRGRGSVARKRAT